MSTQSTTRSYIELRIPERIRLFFNNCYHSTPATRVRNDLFELYSYKLLKPYFQYRLEQRSHPLKYLFVLSPMRSGSSLLVHLLNSNPEIEGFGESHCTYANYQDLEKLIYRTAVIQTSFNFENASYVMDKVVRNHELSNDILANQGTKFIFLLRDPTASFKSAANLGKACYGLSQYQHFDTWVQYYQERLDFLKTIAQQVNSKERCLFVNYEDLLHNTQASLKKFQDFLQTKATFSEDYTVSKNTGVLRYGDPSEILKLGKISRQEKSTEKQLSIFSQQERELAYRIYRNCINIFHKHAQTVMISNQR